MRALLLVVLLVGTARADGFHDALATLAKSAHCPAPSAWCAAARWDSGVPGELPVGKVLRGTMVQIPHPQLDDAIGAAVEISKDRKAAYDVSRGSIPTLLPEDDVTAGKHGWTWSDKGGNHLELRRVGDFWIAIVDVSRAARGGGSRWLVLALQ